MSITINEQPTPIQNEIARQLHHQKPAHLVPGKHIGFVAVTDEDGHEGIGVLVNTDGTKALVLYDEGRDTYIVSVKRFNDDKARAYDDVYCDQLGAMVYGSDAEPF